MPFTAVQDDILRSCYKSNRYGSNANKKAVIRLGLSSSIVLRRAVELGLTHTRERYRWTPSEIDLVEKYAHLSPESIQRRLQKSGLSPIKRTRAAIIGVIHDNRFRTNLDGLNHSQLSSALGLSIDTLHKYRIAGLLKGSGRLPSLNCHKYRGRRLASRPETFPSAPWFYTNREIREFIYCHPGLIDLSKVSKLWFIDLLRDGRSQHAIDSCYV